MADKVHSPNARVIDEVWIGMSEDDDGKNGIVATIVPGFGGTPMVTSSQKVLDYFKQTAGTLSVEIGRRIKIYRFTRVECFYDSEKSDG
jgi:hypothetical protein